MYVIIYNPISRGGKAKKDVKKIIKGLEENDEKYSLQNFLEIDNLGNYIMGLKEDENPIFVGGDGTLHILANIIEKYHITRDVYAYPSGTGNDFFRNIDQLKKGFIRINDFMKYLPYYEAGDQKEVYLNGTGTGIDALVCQYVTEQQGGNAFSYFKNALKAFINYKPDEMNLTVDGVNHNYKKCWFISCMNGMCQGGGMKFCPTKKVDDRSVHVVVAHSLSRLGVALLFVSIYKGKHIKYKKYIDYFVAKDVKVEVKANPPMQTDGEVYKKIKSFEVHAR